MSSLPSSLIAFTKEWTRFSTWWVFWGASILGFACLALRTTAFARRLREGDVDARRGLAAGLGLFVLALSLRCLLPEPTHYTFADEYEYVDFARRLSESGIYHLSSSPPAGLFVFAAVFRLLGPSSDVAFAVTILLASLTPPALYWMLRVLGAERALATTAGALLAIAPLHIKHAASASLEIASIFFVLLAAGTFVEALRAPGWLSWLCFATSLFGALTIRVENFLLAALLPILAPSSLARPRIATRAQAAVVAISVLLAAAYLPGILEAPIRYDPWWKSRLPSFSLLATNLDFWVGGDVWQRKVPFLVACIGIVAGLRSSRALTLFWIAYLLLYSVAFVAYGLNVGYLEEAHQPPPWGARGEGHDMFRFNVVLLPAIVFLLASGVLALVRGAAILLRGESHTAAWSTRSRLAVFGAGGAMLAALLLHGEASSYRPLEFISSRYNRGFQIAEFRFLHDYFRGRESGSALYVLPSAATVVIAEVEVRPMALLTLDQMRAPDTRAFVYVNGRQLAGVESRRSWRTLRRQIGLEEVARRNDGGDRFYLFAVRVPDRSPR